MPATSSSVQTLGTHLLESDLVAWLVGGLGEQQLAGMNSHLQGCPMCQSDLHNLALTRRDPIAVEAFYPERRGQIRRPVSDPAMLRILSPFDPRSWEVRILDVSKGGARVQVPERLMTGSIVQLRMRELLCLGEVRYCVEAQGICSVGLRIDDAFPLPPRALR